MKFVADGYCGSYSTSCGGGDSGKASANVIDSKEHIKEKNELKKKLSPLQYKVTQEAGTERAFTGKYYDHHEKGIYKCVVCGEPLFPSKTKYDSGSGWPSFFAPVNRNSVVTVTDRSLLMTRTEVRCKKVSVLLDKKNITNLQCHYLFYL